MTKRAIRLRDGLRSERGIAVPMALMLIVIGIGLAGAAIMATVNTQRGSVRDQDRKDAIAAADAGVSQALYRENKVLTTASSPCVTLAPGGGGLVAGSPVADGWCPQRTGTVGTTSYAYRVKPWELVTVNQQQLRRSKLVSVGASDDILRRVAVTSLAPTGVNVFGNNGAIGVDGVTIAGTSEVNVSTGSNGSVTIENNGTLCGDGRHGPDGDLVFDNNGVQCPGYSEQEGLMFLPPPVLPTTNDAMTRFFGQDPRTGNVTWDRSRRILTMQGNSTLSLGGHDYVLCRLDMSGGSTLFAGENVRIFFDSPENCGMSSVAEQIKVIGTSSIVSSGYDPDAGIFDLVGLYVVGSDTIETSAYFSGTGDVVNQFILYAPRTDVVITGTASYEGAVAGKTLLVDGTATLIAHPNFPSPDVDVLILYTPERYVECTGATGSPPDANC